MAVEGDRADRRGAAAVDGPSPPRRRLWVSRSPGRVVVRYADGRVLKGYADFDPEQATFLLAPLGGADTDAVEVTMSDLKAVFFVRSFDGDPRRDESKDLYQPRPPGTRKVSVRFRDGEELVGHTRQLDSQAAGGLQPARARHPCVEQHQVGLRAQGNGYGLVAVGGGPHDLEARREQAAEGFEQERVVLGEDDAGSRSWGKAL